MNEGEKNGRAKLTLADISVIRAAQSTGKRGWKSHLARRLGVHPSTITRICTRARWASVVEAVKEHGDLIALVAFGAWLWITTLTI